MLLGKRPRPPMKRTTSMTEITFDLNLNTNSDGAPAPPPPSDSIATTTAHHNRQRQPIINSCGGAPQRRGGGLDQQIIVPTTTLSSTVSPRNHRRNSADFLETPHFLRACSLCNRRLIPGRDIYMYRGDSAFCSLECRQKQMNLDERVEKCSMASKKEVSVSSSTTTGPPQVTTKGETVAAL
uniref:FLZ-type domain-containing protein n=1 Tax=Fagus sylvatica TaxID=28930 RepID=A0A2N9ED41_FAGSY